MLSVKEVVETMTLQNDLIQAYLQLSSGEFFMVSEESLLIAEREEDDLSQYADWEQLEIAIAKQVLAGQDFLALPDRFAMNEFAIRQRFCDQLIDQGDDQKGDELLQQLGGRGFADFTKP